MSKTEYTPQSFLQTFAGRPPEEIENVLKPFLNQAVEDPGFDHGSWAETAEALNLPYLALREAQLAVRDQPQNPAGLKRLGQMLLERGQALRAQGHLQAALEINPDDPELMALLAEIPSADLENENTHTTEAQTAPMSVPHESSAIRFLQTFGGREDMHARQWAQRDGRSGYSPVQQPLTPRLIQGHLMGNDTLGVYCLRLDGTVNFIAFDLDITKNSLEEALVNPIRAQALKQSLQDTMFVLQQGLRDLGLEPLLENSGYKGRHLWLLLQRPLSAEVAFVLGSLFYRQMQAQIPAGLHLEVFPKQAQLNTKKGIGNLIKLPLGIHRKSNRRSHLIGPDGEVIRTWDRYLADFPRMSPDQIYVAIENLKRQDLPELQTSPQKPLSSTSDLPAPPPVQRVWTAADFETDPEVKHVLERCETLRHLKQQAETNRQLSNDEQLVLIHTLGHVKAGNLAVNYLFSRCANIAPDRYLKSTLHGSPTSCAKIRARIPHITSKLNCNCRFESAPEHYPTPELHLRTLENSPVSPTAETLEQTARRYASLERRLRELEQEKILVGKQLAQALSALAEPCIQLKEGRYRLTQIDETQVLEWVPDDGA